MATQPPRKKISEQSKNYVETLVKRCFKESTGQDYVEGKPNIKRVDDREKYYDIFLITYTNYNWLRKIPERWKLPEERNLTNDELEYLCQVCDVGNQQIIAYFNKETGYAPPMFFLYLTLMTYTDTEPPTNISKITFKDMKLKDGTIMVNEMRTIMDKVVEIYERMKPLVEKELEKNGGKVDEKINNIPVFPNPYIYFIYPEIYSKMKKTIIDDFWKNNTTQQLETCKILEYLNLMEEQYKKAYQHQEKFNNAVTEYIKNNKLSEAEIKGILENKGDKK